MMHWLSVAHAHDTKADHKGVPVADYDTRLAARARLAAMAGGELLLSYETPNDAGEPEVLAK